MKRVKVLIPFHRSATNTDHIPNDIIEVSEEELARINAISVNMVEVLGNVEAKAPAKPKTSTKAKK